jgi:S1-C subfamily serine protease
MLMAALVLTVVGQRVPAGEAPASSAAKEQATAAERAAREQAATAEREAKERELAAAQRELEAAARKVAELSQQMGAQARDQLMFNYRVGGPPRAMLGVQIGNAEGQGGARVENVSPGGPAAEAGIKAGDVITSIGGEDLTKDSNPGRALQERMRQVDPNLKVQVGVLRDGKKLTMDVTPRPSPDVVYAAAGGPVFVGGPTMGPGFRTGPGAGPLPNVMPLPPGGPAGVRQFVLEREEGGMGQRFRGMEFATLSEQLGSYFGVKSGVLVVRAGSDPAFKLKDGDVILSIDGREPTNAQHAGRILRSYQGGEKLSLRIQRDRKAQNVEVTVPGGRED